MGTAFKAGGIPLQAQHQAAVERNRVFWHCLTQGVFFHGKKSGDPGQALPSPAGDGCWEPAARVVSTSPHSMVLLWLLGLFALDSLHHLNQNWQAVFRNYCLFAFLLGKKGGGHMYRLTSLSPGTKTGLEIFISYCSILWLRTWESRESGGHGLPTLDGIRNSHRSSGAMPFALLCLPLLTSSLLLFSVTRFRVNWILWLSAPHKR